MSDPVGNYENALAMDLTIKVTVKTPENKEDLAVPGNGSVRQVSPLMKCPPLCKLVSKLSPTRNVALV